MATSPTRRRMTLLVLAASLTALMSPVAGAQDLRSLLLDAQEKFAQGHYAQALKLYRQANELESDHAAITYNIGLCHFHLSTASRADAEQTQDEEGKKIDADQAITQFEKVASRDDIGTELRRDAFYNIGVIKAASARAKYDALFAPTTQPGEDTPPDDPSRIEQLTKLADEFLSAIAPLREARDLATNDDVEHNIRAARLHRRHVLGLLHQAMEKKEKEDIKKDPRRYLETLIREQDQQLAMARQLSYAPPEKPDELRHARRFMIRMQRKIMEQTGLLADELAQFKQAADQPAATSAPATQPAEETPMEKVYHNAAKLLETAVQSQRDACAFLMDGEMTEAETQQVAVLDAMHAALFSFPVEPAQALVAARDRQTRLRGLVEQGKRAEHWLWEPALGPTPIPDGTQRPAEQTGIHYHQKSILGTLLFLTAQCDAIAAASQPAGQAQQQDPMLDPELNRGLAETLKPVEELTERCLTAISDRDRGTALAAQQEILDIIDAALEILPKTLPEIIAKLAERQATLNEETLAEARGTDSVDENAAPLDQIRQWAAKLKQKLLPGDVSNVAGDLLHRQREILADTIIVTEQVKEQVPDGATTQPATQPGQPGDQTQTLIEVGKHLTNAEDEMGRAIEGLDQAVIDKSLKPLGADGPVRAPQARALEELALALMALQPPEQQQDDQQEQQNQQQDDQQEQQQEPEPSDAQQSVDQTDREREEAMRQLYKRRPRDVIKDW